MKRYDNDIYPISLVLSHDAESVDKEYFNACNEPNEHIVVKPTSKAVTMFLTCRTDRFKKMAVGIIFNNDVITVETQAHEAFHATRMMAEIGCGIYLDDNSEEAWAYLNGWIMGCISNYFANRKNKLNKNIKK